MNKKPPGNSLSGLFLPPLLTLPANRCFGLRQGYFRDCGLDVTSEHSSGGRLDPFVGLQPMAWV